VAIRVVRHARLAIGRSAADPRYAPEGSPGPQPAAQTHPAAGAGEQFDGLVDDDQVASRG